METSCVLLIAACVCAACAGMLRLKTQAYRLYVWVMSVARVAPGERKKVFCQLFFMQGVRCLYPLSARLMHVPSVYTLVSECMKSIQGKVGTPVRLHGYMSSCIALCVVFIVVLGLVLGSFLSSTAVLVAVFALVLVKLRNNSDKHHEHMRQCVPDSIQGMKSCFQAGFSLEQTLEYLSQHTDADMQQVYDRALQTLRLGGNVGESLDVLKEEIKAPEFSFVIAALDIQHRTGGSLSSVLQDAEEAARGQFELERSLRTQTAQARLSARVVSVMPLVLVGVFSLVTEGFLEPFFSSIAGFLLFALACTMQAMGIYLVRKTLHVRGVIA